MKQKIIQFKKAWGQSHKELCLNLGYAEDAEDLLMSDYFWLESTSQWYPKSASLYSKEEQKIANQLRSQQ